MQGILSLDRKIFPVAVLALSVASGFGGDAKAGSLDSPVFEGKVSRIEAPAVSATSAEDAIEQRVQQYQLVVKEARGKGFIVGFANGAVIGGGLSGEVGGVLVGGILGGLMGRYVADNTASSLVLEHQNYLVHRKSLEDILESARKDRENSSFDLQLSQSYLSEVEKSPSGKSNESAVEGVKLFRHNAIGRMLALQEVAPQYTETKQVRDQIEAEVKAQRAMVEAFTKVIQGLR